MPVQCPGLLADPTCKPLGWTIPARRKTPEASLPLTDQLRPQSPPPAGPMDAKLGHGPDPGPVRRVLPRPGLQRRYGHSYRSWLATALGCTPENGGSYPEAI